MRRQHNTHGFTLVEILITVLILSIGLLGLAGLQVSSMKSNHSAYLRTQATLLAYDMIDRMRANPNAVSAGQYEAKTDYNVNTSVNPYAVDSPAKTDNCLSTTGCTTQQMANTDVNLWRVDIAERLPGGMAVICLDNSYNDGTSMADLKCNGGTVYAVKIFWNDERAGSGELTRFSASYAP